MKFFPVLSSAYAISVYCADLYHLKIQILKDDLGFGTKINVKFIQSIYFDHNLRLYFTITKML